MSPSPLEPLNELPESDQLWMFSEMFFNDWADNVILEGEYRTNISSSLSQSEHRYGLLSRPVHTLRVTLQASSGSSNGREVSALRNLAQRASAAKSLWPLFSDQTETIQEADSGDTVIYCDTNLIRFSEGGRVLIVSPKSQFVSRDQSVQIAEVSSVASDSITLTAGISADVAAKSLVIPLFEARLMLSVQGDIITDTAATLSIIAVEEEGPCQIKGLCPVGDTPSGYETHEGLPVFEPSPNFADNISWGVARSGRRTTEGVSGVSVVYGSRGLAQLDLPMTFTSRSEAFDVLRLFDSRGGKLHAFWLLSPVSDYYDFQGTLAIPGQGVTSCRLRTAGETIDWESRPYIYFKKRDGNILIREVQSVAKSSEDIFIVTFTQPLPDDISSIELTKTGIAYKMRFDQDFLSEEWFTSEAMETSLTVVELEEEKNITIADITEITTTDLLIEAQQGSCSGTSKLLVPCSGCGTQMTICDEDLTATAITVNRTMWQANTSYSKGDHVFRPGKGAQSQEIYKALNDGTSGASEPSWEDTCPAKFYDNDIQWERSDYIYSVLTVPVTCEWPVQTSYGVFVDCADAQPAFSGCGDQGIGLCCLGTTGDWALTTAECFCQPDQFGDVDICCGCNQATDPGCQIANAMDIDCGGSEGTYTVTAVPGDTASCCDGSGRNCQLYRITRTG